MTNGAQIREGSCNPAPMGILPSSDSMPSSKIVFPQHGDNIAPNAPFFVELGVQNLALGNFVDTQKKFLAAPQQLDDEGFILGHPFIVIERIEAGNEAAATNPVEFEFFKGILAPAANGKLGAGIDEGLPEGLYRVSSILSAANHQPVLAPIVQHGALDDIIYFRVSENGIVPPPPPPSSSSDPSDPADPSATSDSSLGPNRRPKVGAVVGGIIGGLVLLALLVALIFYLLRKSRQSNRQKERVSGDPTLTPYPPPSQPSLTPFPLHVPNPPITQPAYPAVTKSMIETKPIVAATTVAAIPSTTSRPVNNPPGPSRVVEVTQGPSELAESQAEARRRSTETVLSAAPSYRTTA